MYPPKFDYYRAQSVDEAVSLLKEHGGAKLLAGGLSLIPAMNLRLADPGTLIDVGRISDLKGIGRSGDQIRIGSLTTHSMVAGSDQDGLPAALKEAAGVIGDPQVRNRGTIGGNISHADPASDLPTAFTMLGATFHMVGPNGSRSVLAADFFTDLFETALEENEILTAVEVPAEGPGTGSAYAKLASQASRYAVLGAAASVTVGANGDCTACSVAVGGLTTHATLVPSVSSSLLGKSLSDENIVNAARAVAEDLDSDEVIGDIFASVDYRLHMAPVFVERALRSASGRTG